MGGLVIMAVQHFGGLSFVHYKSADKMYIRQKLQSLIICVEMLGFAIAHRYAFTYREYFPEHIMGANGCRGESVDELEEISFFPASGDSNSVSSGTTTTSARPISAKTAF